MPRAALCLQSWWHRIPPEGKKCEAAQSYSPCLASQKLWLAVVPVLFRWPPCCSRLGSQHCCKGSWSGWTLSALCLYLRLLLGEQCPMAALACSGCLVAPLHVPAVEDDGGFWDDKDAWWQSCSMPGHFISCSYTIVLMRLRDALPIENSFDVHSKANILFDCLFHLTWGFLKLSLRDLPEELDSWRSRQEEKCWGWRVSHARAQKQTDIYGVLLPCWSISWFSPQG